MATCAEDSDNDGDGEGEAARGCGGGGGGVGRQEVARRAALSVGDAYVFCSYQRLIKRRRGEGGGAGRCGEITDAAAAAARWTRGTPPILACVCGD